VECGYHENFFVNKFTNTPIVKLFQVGVAFGRNGCDDRFSAILFGKDVTLVKLVAIAT
jgi:hypothetical protein